MHEFFQVLITPTPTAKISFTLDVIIKQDRSVEKERMLLVDTEDYHSAHAKIVRETFLIERNLFTTK